MRFSRDIETNMANPVMSKLFIHHDVEQHLLLGCEEGDVCLVNKLMRLKVNPNVTDRNGVSAITKASAGGHSEIVKRLIQAGAKVNVTSGSKVTPLHAACTGHHALVAKHLILAGANLKAYTTAGIRPIDLAKYGTETWEVVNDASKGEMPEIEEWTGDVPDIPDHALPDGSTKKGKKGGKKGKKGGKKKGGKKGKKGGKKKKKK